MPVWRGLNKFKFIRFTSICEINRIYSSKTGMYKESLGEWSYVLVPNYWVQLIENDCFLPLSFISEYDRHKGDGWLSVLLLTKENEIESEGFVCNKIKIPQEHPLWSVLLCTQYLLGTRKFNCGWRYLEQFRNACWFS